MSQPDSKDFGFGDLGSFDPTGDKAERPDPEVMREIHKAGAEIGYRKREPDAILRIKRAVLGATTPLYMRLEPDVFNRYVRLSQEAHKGRADFLVSLMDSYERERR